MKLNDVELKEFMNFLQTNFDKPKKQLFSEYAEYKHVAEGSVRNLYYSIAKQNGLSVKTPTPFSSGDEEKLLTEILSAKQRGESVRSTLIKLCNGDAKLFLRYQNKYRNIVKYKPDLLKTVFDKINTDDNSRYPFTNKVKSVISESQFEKLKNDINGLINKITSSKEKENELLKHKISCLEIENIKLTNMLYSDKYKKALKYCNIFSNKAKNTLPN